MYENDKHVISYALYMWKNYVETGDVNAGKQSYLKMNREDKIKHLDSSQQEFINRLDKLANDILNDKKVIIDKSK